MAQPDAPESPATPALRGEAVYFFAFDIAYDLRRTGLDTLLGQKLEPFRVDTRKRTPRGQVFYQPLMARLPGQERTRGGEPVSVSISVKVLPVGAVSIMLRIPFSADSIAGLAWLHDPAFDDGETLSRLAGTIAEQARRELAAAAVRPHTRLPEGEAYMVFCIDCDSPAIRRRAPAWLDANRTEIASLLTRESAAEPLSAQEISEATGRGLSYYQHDLVVADWDAAVVVDRPADFDETLYVMELANVQLEELEAYDFFIDEALERAYRDLGGPGRTARGSVLKELREIRIDLTRFSDELSNITKFFGEWHLARVYENTARLFHLGDWHRAIDEKLRTLDSLYEMLKQDLNHRVMLWLEVSIVLLFVIDIVMLLAGSK